MPESTALQQWALPPVFEQLHGALCLATRKGHQEYVMVLKLIREHGEDHVAAAVREALQSGSPRLETVRLCLLRQAHDHVPATPLADPRLADIQDIASSRL